MSSWNVDEAAVKRIVGTVTADGATAATQHTTFSTAIDTAAGYFSDAKVSKIKTALNGVYNRCFTHQMTNAETQISNACTKATDAATALHNGQHAIAEQMQSDAAKINWNAPIHDGKKVN